MNDNVKKIIKKYKENLENRLVDDNKISTSPVFSAKGIKYEISERTKAIHCGGIGFIDQLLKEIQFPEMINDKIKLLKRHKHMRRNLS